MQFKVHSFDNGAMIPGDYAFCVPALEGHVAMAPNKNPHLSWSSAPAGTKSFAIICVDPTVPATPEGVNQEGKIVEKDRPRMNFYHWVLVDIPADVNEIREGADSDGITARGKDYGETPLGIRGINDYTNWFKGDENMDGFYGGYDGPCPPWNDELMHLYKFRIFALDVESLGLSGKFNGGDAIEAMKGHVLDEAEWEGTYTLYEKLL